MLVKGATAVKTVIEKPVMTKLPLVNFYISVIELYINRVWQTVPTPSYHYLFILHHFQKMKMSIWMKIIICLSYTQAVNTGWWEIDIHGCYSLVKIALAPICACKNNRQIWRHNASISRSPDVTDPLRWHHNAKSETTVLADSCEMSDRWLFLADLCVQGHKIACKK